MENNKDFKQENINKKKEKWAGMAYYCRKCGLWHYPGSRIFYEHRRYAARSPSPRRVVRRRRKSFWDRF